MRYKPNKKSLNNHKPPEWYNKAKFGIFIHWGLYSVPAFAPVEYGLIYEIISKYGVEFNYSHNPYAEWYQNSIRINDEPYRSFHNKHFGEHFKYEQFADIFNDEIKKWNPNKWITTFKEAGAKYIVLVTKHHDGFRLWESNVKHPDPKYENYFASRNIVKELAESAKNQDFKIGLYYSGAIDWSLNKKPIVDATTMLANANSTKKYAQYCDNQFLDLIDSFKPDILWNDIAYPVKGNLYKIIAHYYNTVEHGVINERWRKIPKAAKILQHTFITKKLINYFVKKSVAKHGFTSGNKPKIADYITPEYHPTTKLLKTKWESCRGIGRSFGYNRMEKDEHHISIPNLIHSFIDIVSKNGNLLLNVGPKADGTIPELQLKRLKALGDWLDKFGEGIFGTEPWDYAESTTTTKLQVRFTQKEKQLFIYILGTNDNKKIEINNLRIPNNSKISLINTKEYIDWKQDGSKLSIELPSEKIDEYAFCVKIEL